MQLETLLEAASEDVKVVNGNGEISEAAKVTAGDMMFGPAHVASPPGTLERRTMGARLASARMLTIEDAQDWTQTLKWKEKKIPFPILHRPKHHLEKTLDELEVEDFYLKPVYVLAPHI